MKTLFQIVNSKATRNSYGWLSFNYEILCEAIEEYVDIKLKEHVDRQQKTDNGEST